MELLEALKAAKKHLATTNNRIGKTNYVCLAVGRAFIEKYGNFVEIPPRSRTKEQKALDEKLEAVQAEVVERLFDLQRRYGINTLQVFTKDCAKAVLGLRKYHEVIQAEVQKARHIWLDSLIQELENGTD